MPTIGVEPLKVERLLKEVSFNIKEIQVALSLYPSDKVFLLQELAGWSELMVELLSIITIHRGLNLPDDAPESLLQSESSEAEEINLSSNILDDTNMIDRRGNVSEGSSLTPFSIPTTNNNTELTLDSKSVNTEEKDGYRILNFFKRVLGARPSAAKEPVNSSIKENYPRTLS